MVLDERLDIAASKIEGLKNKINDLLELAESIEDEAIREIQVEKLSGNIVKEEHWKGQMVAARIIIQTIYRKK